MDLFFIGILFYLFHHVDGEQCTFKPPCSCSTPDYKIDLSPMMKQNSDPLKTTYLGATYYLNPCGRPLSVPQCSSLGPVTAGCQVSGGVYGIATTSDYSAEGDPSAGTVVFTYSYGTGGQKRTTKMKLKCSSHDRLFKGKGEDPVRTYNFELFTKYACKHIPSDGDGGLSLGSILLIVFFVLIIIYLVGGILFLKYYRKAEGVEIIPNLALWKELPLLIKDGFAFTISKTKRQSTYDAI